MITRNIVLIGMPASGKSSLGRRLARRLNMPFVDTDDLLKAQTGLEVLGDIQKKLGSEGYQAAEERAVCSLNVRGTIIATGGSVPLSHTAMRHLKQNGTIIFLHVPVYQLARRVGDLERRGVLKKTADQGLQEVFEERWSIYRRYADITISSKRIGPGQYAEVLAGMIRFLYDRPAQATRKRNKGKRPRQKRPTWPPMTQSSDETIQA